MNGQLEAAQVNTVFRECRLTFRSYHASSRGSDCQLLAQVLHQQLLLHTVLWLHPPFLFLTFLAEPLPLHHNPFSTLPAGPSCPGSRGAPGTDSEVHGEGRHHTAVLYTAAENKQDLADDFRQLMRCLNSVEQIAQSEEVPTAPACTHVTAALPGRHTPCFDTNLRLPSAMQTPTPSAKCIV
jgi:hypothetical protein